MESLRLDQEAINSAKAFLVGQKQNNIWRFEKRNLYNPPVLGKIRKK